MGGKLFRTRFSFADVLVMLSVLLIASLLLFGSFRSSGNDSSDLRLVIRTQSEVLSYPLSSDRTIPVASGGYTLTVEIRE